MSIHAPMPRYKTAKKVWMDGQMAFQLYFYIIVDMGRYISLLETCAIKKAVFAKYLFLSACDDNFIYHLYLSITSSYICTMN